jgi:hypothetical protein
MTPADLQLHLDSYLSLREALGFQMRVKRPLLRDFVQFIEPAHVSGPIRAQLAVAWACASSSKRGAGGAPQRLSMARGFLTYLRATRPETEVPERDLIAFEASNPANSERLSLSTKDVLIVQPHAARTCWTASRVPNTTRCLTPTKRLRLYCLITCA